MQDIQVSIAHLLSAFDQWYFWPVIFIQLYPLYISYQRHLWLADSEISSIAFKPHHGFGNTSMRCCNDGFWNVDIRCCCCEVSEMLRRRAVGGKLIWRYADVERSMANYYEIVLTLRRRLYDGTTLYWLCDVSDTLIHVVTTLWRHCGVTGMMKRSYDGIEKVNGMLIRRNVTWWYRLHVETTECWQWFVGSMIKRHCTDLVTSVAWW